MIRLTASTRSAGTRPARRQSMTDVGFMPRRRASSACDPARSLITSKSVSMPKMVGTALRPVKRLAKHGFAAHDVVMPYTRAVEIWRRIEESRRLGGLSKADLARRTGVSRATASQWEGHGSRAIARPSWDSLKLIASACGVDFNWLATGLGSPTGRSDAVFTEEELDLLYALTQLPAEVRRPLEEQIRALAAALSDNKKAPPLIPEQKG